MQGLTASLLQHSSAVRNVALQVCEKRSATRSACAGLPLAGSVSWNASGWSGLSPITTIHPTMEVILLGLVLNCKQVVSKNTAVVQQYTLHLLSFIMSVEVGGLNCIPVLSVHYFLTQVYGMGGWP